MPDFSQAFNSLSPRLSLISGSRQRHVGDTDATSTPILAALRHMGLVEQDEHPRTEAITGQGSSGMYRVQLAAGTVCVKCDALDVSAEWLKLARAIVGESVPEVLGQQSGLFAMEYLDPSLFPTWEQQLRDGVVDPAIAAECGRLMGRIHAATANNVAIAERFATERVFQTLRIEPYLLASTVAYPELAVPLHRLARSTTNARLTLVHGGIHPGNIRVGPEGPMLPDAEVACYGDPAFDVAFCLSHLLLNSIRHPLWFDAHLTCFDVLSATYSQRISWEDPAQIEERAARLLPGIVLACVAGESPARYIADANNRERVSGIARRMLVDPLVRLAAVRETWRRAFFD